MTSFSGDLVGLSREQEALRQTVGVYDGFAAQPGLAVALARSGATGAQIAATGGFLRGLELSKRVALARESGVRLDLTDDDRAALAAADTPFYDVDKARIEQAAAVAQQPQAHQGFLSKVSWVANRFTTLPIVKEGFEALDRGADIANTGARAATSGGLLRQMGIHTPGENISLDSLVPGRQASFAADAAETQRGMAQAGYNPDSTLSTLAFLSRGKQVFRNMDDLRRDYNPEHVDLAQHYLIDPQSFMDPKLPLPELTRRDAVLRDPAFKGLVDEVDSRRISPGRDIAAGTGFQPGTKPYTVVSGSTDAVWAFAADPTIILGAGVKGVRATQLGIAGVSDTTRIEALMRGNTAVRRGWETLLDDSKVMRSGTREEAAAAYARVHARTPELLPLVDEVNGGGLREGVNGTATGGPIDTYEDLIAHVTGTTALVRLRNGIAASEAKLMPGAVSAYGARRLKAWAAGTRTTRGLRSIDLVTEANKILPDVTDATGMAGEDVTGLSGAVGDAALAYRKSMKGRLDAIRRKWELLPERQSIDLSGSDGAESVRRFAALYMPRSHAAALAARYATATLGERRSIVQAVEDQVIHAAGIPSTVSGQAWLTTRRRARVQADNSAYDHSGNGGDLIAGEGEGDVTRRSALYASQTNDTYHLPNFRELRQIAAKVTVYERTLGRAFESDAMDRLLSTVRTPWIITLSNALRNSLEAVASAGTRDVKVRDLLRSRAALTTAAAHGGTIRRHLGDAAGVFSNEELTTRAHELIQMGLVGDLDDFRALTGQRGGVTPDDEMADALGRGYRVAPLKSDGFHLDSADGMRGAKLWYTQLRLRAGSPEGRRVAQAATYTGTKAVKARTALIDFMLSDAFKTERAKLERFGTLRNGELVGDDPAMIHRAAEELADDQIADMRALVSDETGGVIPDVAQAMRRGSALDVKKLIDLPSRPASVVQPKYVLDLTSGGDLRQNVAQAVGDRAYDLVVARPMNWLANLPILHANYVKAYRDVEKALREPGALTDEGVLADIADTPAVRKARAEDDALAEKIREVALQHATDRTIDLIDNPRVRSQFALVSRNFFNFWRAQEDFLRRWARNAKESPEDIRKAQLVIEGGMHTGIVVQNEDGELTLNYPGSGHFINVLSNALSHFGMGAAVKLPVLPNLSTKLTFLNAGLDRPLLPTISPTASIAVRALKHFSGDQIGMIQGQQILEGEIGAGRAWWAQFLPSIVYRPMAALSKDDREGQYASASRNAVLNAFADGELKPDATPSEVQDYKDRIRTGVRNHLMFRAAFGLIAPGAPSTPSEESDASRTNKLERKAWNSVSFKDEFRAMANKLGYDNAHALWAQTHPHELIYTVATTETAGGAPTLSPTDEVLGWMKDNPELVQKYPQLAPYFAPNGPGDFSSEAWRAELELGLRRHKTLDTFYRDVVVKNAEDTYYKMRDKRDKLVAEALGADDTDRAKAIKQSFTEWSGEYQGANPLLGEKFAQSAGRAATAAGLVNELSDFAKSPMAAKHDPNGSLKLLLDAFNKKDKWDSTHHGRTKDDLAMKDQINGSYQSYIASVLGESPYLIPLWQGIFEKAD